MKRLLRDKWVAALRSGEFRQGRTRLARSPDECHAGFSFCCMGVLCEIAAPFTRTELELATTIATKPYQWIAEQLGDPVYSYPKPAFHAIPEETSFTKRLANLNDISGKTFTEIADWIEVNIPCQD